MKKMSYIYNLKDQESNSMSMHRIHRITFLFLFLLFSRLSFAQVSSPVVVADTVPMDTSIWKEHDLEGVTITAKRITHNEDGYRAMIASEKMYKSRNLFDAMLTLPGIDLSSSTQNTELKAYGESITAVYVDEKRLRLSGKQLYDYIRSLPAREVVSVQVLNPNQENELIDGSGYVLKIKTVSGRGGGRVTLGLGAEFGNDDDFSLTPSATIMQTFEKFSYTANVSYTPRAHKNRDLSSVTDYYPSGYQRVEQNNFDILQRHNTSYLLGMQYDFNKYHSLALNLRGGYEDRTRFETTENTFHRDIDVISEGETGMSWQNNVFRSSLEYNGTIKKVNLVGILYGALRSHRSDNDRWQLADETETYANTHRKKHIRIVGGIARMSWNINKKQRLSLGTSYSHWNNFIDSRRVTSSMPTDYLYYYKYKEDNLKLNADFRQKIGKLTVTVGARYNHISTRFAESPESNTSENYFLPKLTMKYVIDSDKGNYAQLTYRNYIEQPAFDKQVADTTWDSEYMNNSGSTSVQPIKWHFLHGKLSLYDYVFNVNYVYNSGPSTLYSANDDGVISAIENNGYKLNQFELTLFTPMYKICKSWMVKGSVGMMYWHEDFNELTNCCTYFYGSLTSMNELPYDFSLMVNLMYAGKQRKMFHTSDTLFLLYASLSRSWLKNKLNTSVSVNWSPRTESILHADSFRMVDISPSNYRVSFNLSYTFGWGKKLKRVNNNENDEMDRL